MKDLILVLSYHKDSSLTEIFDGFKKHAVRVLRIDTGDFPSSITLDARHTTSAHGWSGTFTHKGERYALEDIRSILYRRPTHYRIDPSFPPQLQTFAEREADKGFGGILRSLDCLWVSDPEQIRRANFKPFQLSRARQVGLTTPESLITNDPEAFTTFYKQHENDVIIKTLHGGSIGIDDEHWDAIYTSRVTPESLKHLEQIRLTAHYFQAHIPKAFELRITVVGDQVFTAQVHSQGTEASRTDFRAGYAGIRYNKFELPQDIKEKCIKLTRNLGLSFSTIDMAVTPDGSYIYFETNAIGQFQWIEVATQLPIGQAIADLCVEGIGYEQRNLSRSN